MRVVDAGANVGYFTVLAGGLAVSSGSVIAFEPNRRVAMLTEIPRAANYLDWVNIANAAVADHCGDVTLCIPNRCFGGASLHGYTGAGANLENEVAERQEAPCTTLDEYFRNDDARIDIIKIDTDSSEPNTLDGMRGLIERNPRMRLIDEFYVPLIRASGSDPGAFPERVPSPGFRLHEIGSHGRLRSVPEETLLARTPPTSLFLLR